MFSRLIQYKFMTFFSSVLLPILFQ